MKRVDKWLIIKISLTGLFEWMVYQSNEVINMVFCFDGLNHFLDGLSLNM